MARGRKRKVVVRTKTDRATRAGLDPFDRGTDRTKAKQALFGQDGCDAVGRAYRAGLLGELSEAKAFLDTARRIAHDYRRFYTVGPITCTLGDRNYGSTGLEDAERAQACRKRLHRDLTTIAGKGFAELFHDLVIVHRPDQGPDWLDRLIAANGIEKNMPLRDKVRIAKALEAIALVVA
jgi:hypothetical protein